MKKPTQNERVLAAMRAAGSRGIDRTDFQAPNVIDGGDIILNFPARIQDLEEQGWLIGTGTPRRHNCTVYTLAGRVKAPPLTEPITTPDGCWLIVHSCARCLGCVARPEQACGRTTRTLWSVSAPAGVLGCRVVEARADQARRNQRDQGERRAA